MNTRNNILLTGSTGKLGKAILALGNFGNDVLAPNRALFDLTDFEKLTKYLDEHTPCAIINCAAMARMIQCEQDPGRAIETNIIGTANLVRAVLQYQKKFDRTIRFVHISTDGVYPSIKGGYKETSPTIPYNTYGWTKLGSETSVRILKNSVIIRTRFFDGGGIQFKDSPVDLFTSKIPIEELVDAIKLLLESDYTGVVNVGRKEKISEYRLNKQYNKDLAKSTRKEIMMNDGIQLAKDASMNTSLWRRIEKKK